MSFNVPLHRVSVLVGNPTGRTTGSVECAPIRRNARDPLDNTVPRDMGSGGDNRWVGGVHHHKVTAVKSTYEVREERGIHT